MQKKEIGCKHSEKEELSPWTVPSYSNVYYITAVIKAVWYYQTNKHIGQWNKAGIRNRPKICSSGSWQICKHISLEER